MSTVGPDGGAWLALTAFFAPAAVLSAVNPTVVKLQLRDLAVTGRVVGRLSALATAGALVGTYLAGFVLVERAPTTTTILFIGCSLMAAGAVVWLWLSIRSGRLITAVAVVALAGTGLGAVAGDPCDVETVYHCARIVTDEDRPTGRRLVLDTLEHSYVDLADPTHLELGYTRVFADLVAAESPPGPLDVLHLGGGGFTMPRFLREVRPGSTSTVVEIDPGVVRLARERLGLTTAADLQVRVGDARKLVVAGSHPKHDVVLGDAFGGLAVPWHLTTVEFVRAVRSTLSPGGVYILNVIDEPPMRFARSEARTLLEVFDHVMVIAPPASLERRQGGNVVLAGSDGVLDGDRIAARIAARGGEEEVLVGAAADDFAGDDVDPLTDDHAPVDQWLARARR